MLVHLAFLFLVLFKMNLHIKHHSKYYAGKNLRVNHKFRLFFAHFIYKMCKKVVLFVWHKEKKRTFVHKKRENERKTFAYIHRSRQFYHRND